MGVIHKKIDYVYLPENTILKNGYYRIIKRLTARSNFSIVYFAKTREGNEVLIKELFPKNIVLRDLDGISLICKNSRLKVKYKKTKNQFISEAIILLEFKHNECICSLYDYFKENNTIYLVMKYYSGKTLEDII